MEKCVRHIVLWVCTCIFCSGISYGQEKARPDTVRIIDRFSFRTNAFEWLVTIPNAGVEFDLSKSPYRKTTIGLTAKYNWPTYHNYSPPMVFNFSEIKPEFRKYWRPVNKEPRDPSDTTKRGFFKWLKEDVFTNAKVNAKTGRAYYVGVYANAGTYAYKFGKTGRQGSFCGLGISLGYGVPLYSYTRNFIDVEFGFSLGMLMTRYECFGHNPVGNYYFQYENQGRDWHVVPYPLLTEIKVAFVYRTRSIKDKYDKVDPERLMKKQNRIDAKNQARLDKEQQKADKEAAKVREAEEKEAAKVREAEEKETLKARKAEEKKNDGNLKASDKENTKVRKSEKKDTEKDVKTSDKEKAKAQKAEKKKTGKKQK